MKKSLFIILMVCLALVGLVSCKNEIEPAQEELIYVSFEKGTSRALTATLEDFDVDDFYWSYEAKKNDGSGLKSGQTATWNETGLGSVPVQTGKGLNYDGTVNPVKVPGFSKGYWNFRLFAYADADRTKLAYWGEVDSVLIDSSHHLASVTVSPVAGANGYLKIGTITFNPASTISVPTDFVIYTDELFKLVDNKWVKDETQPVEGVYTLLAGQYKFTRTYSYDGIPVANGSVIATVYSNLTTTISGTLSELTTYAEFGADQNPDIVRENWGSDIIPETSTAETVVFQQIIEPSATNKVSAATMPAAAAVAKIKELEKVVGADDNTSSTLKLNLSVDTTDVRQQSVTYDIGMEAVLTYMKNQQESVAKSDVKNVSDYVLIDINLTSDITGVTVTHSGEAMILTDNMPKAGMPGETDPKYVDINKGTSADPLWVGFYMLETTEDGQVLHLKTKSFSPFEVTYQMTKYVAAIGNVKYTTLAAAVDAATAGQTIFLLEDIDLADQVVVDKKVSLDLNGKRIYNTVDLWEKVPGSWSLISVQEGGALTITGNGTIDAKANDCYAIDVRGGATLVVESGTITGNVTAIYAHDGFVTVKGGSFDLKQKSSYSDYRYMLNCLDASYASDPATAGFTVSGGKFKGFNPGNNLSEGADTNYLAAGYGAKALEDDWYEVVPFDVLNTTTGAGYYLAKEGTYKGKLVDGTGTVITPAPAKTDKLVLLDSKLANIVDDSIDNFHAGYSWTAIHSDAEDDRRNKYFGAGWGTKIEPYAISSYDRLCNVNWPFEGTTETDLYYELTADIDVKAHDSEQWAHSFLYNDPTYYHINMRNHSLTIGNKYLFGYAVKLEMCNGSIVFDGAASVVDYACYQDVSSYEMNFHDLTLSGTVETSNAHYGLLVSYAFGINSGSAAFNASNIVNNVSIFNNNSTAYTGGLFGYVQGTAVSSSVTDCTFNGSIVSAFAGSFLNTCSFPNGAPVVSSGNVLNGSLLASSGAHSFGCNGNITGGAATLAQLDASVARGDSASIVVIPESTDLISVDGDDQVILSRKDNVATYRVAIVFSVHSTEDGKGGYPRYITVDFDQIEDETKATGIYKYEIEQSESDESEGKTVVTDAGSYKIWLDGETYYVYCPDYEIDKTPLDKTRATIWAYGYDADNKMIAYQKIIYTF